MARMVRAVIDKVGMKTRLEAGVTQYYEGDLRSVHFAGASLPASVGRLRRMLWMETEGSRP